MKVRYPNGMYFNKNVSQYEVSLLRFQNKTTSSSIFKSYQNSTGSLSTLI